jgi:hypothetical protein
MKYALLIYSDESELVTVTSEQGEKVLGEYMAFSGEVFGSGAGKAGEALQSSETATTLRVRDGERLVTDGPFAEAREQMGGFYIVDVEDLDAALAWAAKCPGARYGAVEVRPLVDFGDAPA